MANGTGLLPAQTRPNRGLSYPMRFLGTGRGVLLATLTIVLFAACGQPEFGHGDEVQAPRQRPTETQSRWLAQQLRVIYTAEPVSRDTAFELYHICDGGASLYVLNARNGAELAVIPNEKLPRGHPCRASGK